MARKQIHTRDNPSKYFKKSIGYWFVSWQEEGKQIVMLEHRWVWEQANGPIPKGYVIHHIDHDKLNNHISNLQCLTTREHAQHHAEHDGKQTHEILAANPVEYNREYSRQRRAANPEAHNEYMRQHRANNREAYNEYMREYQRKRRAEKKLELAGGV